MEISNFNLALKPNSLRRESAKIIDSTRIDPKLVPLTTYLQVTGVFWDRKVHGLFDYDASRLNYSSIKLVGCSLLAYDDHTEKLKQTYPQMDQPFETLIAVANCGNSYWVYHSVS
jgi:hypothetical protein